MGNIRSKCSKVKENAAQATRSEGGRQPDCCSFTQEASESQSVISTLSVVKGGCKRYLAWNSEGNVIMGPAATLHSDHAVVMEYSSPEKFILKRADNKFGLIWVKNGLIVISLTHSDRDPVPSEFVQVDSRSVGSSSILVKHSGTGQWVKVQDRENKFELAIADKQLQLATPFEVSSV